jgi:hypothetical protein
MTDEPMFDGTGALNPVARASDPATSHEAAQSVRDLTEKQWGVLLILRWDGPATDEQIYAAFRRRGWLISPSGCRTRRKELVEAGLVEDSGRRGVTESGRSTVVWQATP